MLEALGENSFKSDTDRIKKEAREQNLTLRQVALQEATPRTPFMGTPEKVADIVQEWYNKQGVDGFIIIANLPSELTAFVEKVVPILQKRGIYRMEYEGNTLREHLGLPFSENRYTLREAEERVFESVY